MMKLKVISAALLFIPAAVFAQVVVREVHFSIGTGFFVNQEGYLLTNHHVVKPCTGGFTVYGQNATSQAKVVAVDEKHDLALLKTAFAAAEIGEFNPMENLPAGARLTIVGYPGKAWQKREPVVREATFLDNKGPAGEKHLLQFSDSVAQGNSGGPLLDEAGNVAGVIVAKSTVYSINMVTREKKEVRKADVAINLPTVWQFLDENRVPYIISSDDYILTEQQIINKSKRFIVNVRCVTDAPVSEPLRPIRH